MFAPSEVQIRVRKRRRRDEGAGSSVKLLPGARQRVAGGAGGAADHLHPPGGHIYSVNKSIKQFY